MKSKLIAIETLLRNGEAMNFDFSHLYHEKTVQIRNEDAVLFEIVVSEIPSGEAANIQNTAMKKVDMSKIKSTTKKGRRAEMNRLVNEAMKETNGAELAIRETLLGVKSWTLTDAKGNPVPVSFEAYKALPKFITKQIDDAVEELNPEADEDFQDSSGDGNSDG